MALKPRQLAAIEYMLANPSASNTEIGEAVKANRNTVSEWRRFNEEFKTEYKRRLKEQWEDFEGQAIQNMQKLANEGNFQANKYILDTLDYAPATKIEADVKDTVEIVIG